MMVHGTHLSWRDIRAATVVVDGRSDAERNEDRCAGESRKLAAECQDREPRETTSEDAHFFFETNTDRRAVIPVAVA